MTRARQPKPTAPPLAVTLRAALASDWRTLAALDTLAGARGSDARRLVHEALRALRGEGCVLEERVGRGGVEVRLAPTLPAPRPDDGDDGLDADDREAARAAIQADLDAEPPCDPDNFEGLEGMRLCLGCEHPAHLHAGGPVGGQCLHQERGAECSCVAWVEPNARTAEPTTALDAPAPPVGQAAPVEAAEGPVARDLDALREQVRTNASVSVSSGLTMAQAWERASVCLDLTPVEEYALCGAWREEWERVTSRPVNALSAHLAAMGHVEEAREVAGLPAPPKVPGPSSRCARPGCNLRNDQHDRPGPRGKTQGRGGCEAFQPKPRGRPRARLADAQAADPDVEELPTAAERKAILDGAKRDYEAAVAGQGTGAEPETSRGGGDGLDAGTLDAIREVIDTAPPSVRERVRARREAAETSRGEAPGEQDHATCDTDPTRPSGSSRVPALRVATPRAPGKPRVPRARAHPVSSADGVDQSAARVGAKDAATAGNVAPPCRPPLCHADDIHEPGRVRGFARALCEAHRRWVEGAGGTLASAADTAALHPEETV